MTQHRYAHLLILGLAIFIGFYGYIWSMPLFDLDEGAFTTATREMFLRHDFITPYLNSVPRFDKPILIYWLQALSASLFGFNEFAFRLPSALASTAWVYAIYRFMAQVTDPERAFYAALIAACSLMTTVVGKAAIADAVLMLFITWAMFAIFRHWQTDRASYIRWAYLAMALGFLTKGPVAVVIPGAVSLLFYLSTGKWSHWWRAVLDWRGVAIFLLVALPWYVLEYIREGQAFIDGFFLKNNVGRFNAAMEGHSGGYWYYPVVTFIALLPFTGLVVVAIRRMASDLNPIWGKPHSDQTALIRFGWIWFLFVLILFSFSGTKLPHYLNYGLVGLILIMAMHFPSIRNRWLHVLPAWIFFAVLLALPSLLDVFFTKINPPYVRDMLADRAQYFGWFWYLPLVLFLALSAIMALQRRKPAASLMIPLALSFSWVVNAQLLPIVASLQQEPIRAAGLIARDLPGDAIMYGMNTPSFGVYAGKILQRHPPIKGDLVLTRTVDLPELPNAQILFEQGGVALLRMR
jgi:4-amino-4-deoxy-L-arabinose transferase-like glycosyltransferase